MAIEYRGLASECAAIITATDAELGYPRTYTASDITSGLVVRHGVGPWAAVESLVTTTVSAADPVDVDINGDPTSTARQMRIDNPSTATRERVGDARVLRLLNRGTSAQLQEVPMINAARADDIIAARPFATISEVGAIDMPGAAGIATALQTRGATEATQDLDSWDEP